MPLAGLSDVAAHGEPGGAERLGALQDAVTPGDGHVVHHPLVHVAFMDALLQELQLLPVCLPLAVGLVAHQLRLSHALHEVYLQTRPES